MARMPGVAFRPPRSYTTGRPGGPPRFLVIHYTAGSEGPTAAEDGVSYDQRRTDGTSAHFYVDRDTILQCVDTDNRSHTAKYYGNLWGIHIEQCGTVQTRAQWLDPASRETIRNAARVCAWAMQAHNIPLARLVGTQVRTGRGICGHADCTTGFPEDNGSHMDPGAAYPYDVLFADIRALLAPQEDNDMEPHTVVPRPLNINYPNGNPPTWPTSGATSEPTAGYLMHAGLAKSDTALNRANDLADEVQHVKQQIAQLADTVTQPIDLERLADLLTARMVTPPTAAEIGEAVADEGHRRSET